MSKFNWGHGIFLFYTVFVLVVILALVASTKVDRSLVTEDYYAKDLAYQEHYNKLKNQQVDQVLEVKHNTDDQKIILTFDTHEDISGHILFYRPSDNDQDFKIEIDKKVITVNTGKLSRGKWIVKADWTSDAKSYYKESQLFI